MKKLSMFLMAVALLCTTSLFAQTYIDYVSGMDATITEHSQIMPSGNDIHFGDITVESGTLEIRISGNTSSVDFDNLVINEGGRLEFIVTWSSSELEFTGDITVNGGELEFDVPNSITVDLAEGSFVLNSGTVILERVDEDGISMNITVNGGSFMLNGQPYYGNTEGGEDEDPEEGEPDLPIENYNLKANQWNFIGLPENGLAMLVADGMPNVWAVDWNASTNAWNTTYLHWNESEQSPYSRGNGIFVWSDGNYNLTAQSVENGSNVTVTCSGGQGNWFPLANPYSFAIDISELLEDYCSKSGKPTHNKNQLQNRTCWTYDGTTFVTNSTIIQPFQAFFVKLNKNFDFEFTPSLQSAATNAPANTDYVTLSVVTDGYSVPVMLEQNNDASESYDGYDFEKMFGSGTVAEPYLVSNGKNLCKEAVNADSYVATMNIKSLEARNVQIVASNIPAGYDVVLFDGEEEIALVEGSVYETSIANGENADRFKIMLKNNVGLADVEELNASIVNNNRHISISAQEDVNISVYNTLGQKVFETEESNFVLNTVPAGAYVMKVQGSKSVKSQKIIIE